MPDPNGGKSGGVTPEENRLLINEIDERTVVAIQKLERTQERLFRELKESEAQTSQKNRWLFGIMSTITLFVVGSIGIPLIIMVSNLGTSVAVLETKITVTDKLERRIKDLESLVNTIDKRTDN